MGKRHLPPLASRRIRLRLLEERDLPQTLAWRNQDHIRRWFFFSERLTPSSMPPGSPATGSATTTSCSLSRKTGGQRQAECAGRSGKWPFTTSIGSGGTAEFGRLMIGEADAAGRGLAREATAAAVALAFEQLGLQEVYLRSDSRQRAGDQGL